MSTATQTPPRPTAPPVNLDAIPAVLRERNQWVLWRFTLRWDKKTRKKEWAKVPYQPNGRKAEADDPRTWSPFDVVAARYRDNPQFWSGIGYEFSADDPFAGVDLDGCRRDDGTFVPWASELLAKFSSPGVPDPIEIIKQLATYAEVSPSGHGVKLIGVGKLPGERNRLGSKENGIECYDQKRYFTVTGHRVPGTPAAVNDCSAALTMIYNGIFGTKPKGKAKSNGKVHSAGKVPTDDEVWDAIAKSKTAGKITALKSGDTAGYPSGSEADMALATYLAFWTRDAAQIDRLMRTTGLVREKWEREDYLSRTIARALETVTESYTWDKTRGLTYSSDDLGLATASGRTEVANGRRLARLHGQDFRWCDPWGKYLTWDGKRWAVDSRRQIDAMAKDVYQSLWREITTMAPKIGDDDGKELKELIRFAKQTGAAHGIEAMLKLARSEPGIPIAPEVLDTDPWLLNCDNGTLDLRTGELRPHRREDYLTKLCAVAYDPKADCPLWCAFLREIMAGDDELLRFLRRAVGMSLTGVVQDHVLLFCYGTGANGKSTLINTVQEMMGSDYAMKAPPDLLMVKSAEGHPTERADLAGKRFVACVEAGEGRRLAESLVKELTGGDRVRARRMREDFWEFSPSHKVWLAANHKPVVRGTDRGIWRRIKLIPFTVAIPEERQDKKLPGKLKGELPGILNWALLGCIEWQATGLGEPESVRRATAEYRSESDILGAFLDECCIVGDGCEAPASLLYNEYHRWAEASGEKPITQTAFGNAMTERGFVSDRFTGGFHKGRKKWGGVGLRAPSQQGTSERSE